MDAHDIGRYLQGLPRHLYDIIASGGPVDWQYVKSNTATLLDEGSFTNEVERLWLRYILARALRVTGAAPIDTVISQLHALQAARDTLHLHPLMAVVYVELVLAHRQAGNTFMAGMMGLNLRLAACSHPACEDHLAALGLQRGQTGSGYTDSVVA